MRISNRFLLPDPDGLYGGNVAVIQSVKGAVGGVARQTFFAINQMFYIKQ